MISMKRSSVYVEWCSRKHPDLSLLDHNPATVAQSNSFTKYRIEIDPTNLAKNGERNFTSDIAAVPHLVTRKREIKGDTEIWIRSLNAKESDTPTPHCCCV